MATIESFRAQCKAREADWKIFGMRFRWSKFRREPGYHCYVVHPVEGFSDKYWWEWKEGDNVS